MSVDEFDPWMPSGDMWEWLRIRREIMGAPNQHDQETPVSMRHPQAWVLNRNHCSRCWYAYWDRELKITCQLREILDSVCHGIAIKRGREKRAPYSRQVRSMIRDGVMDVGRICAETGAEVSWVRGLVSRAIRSTRRKRA
jgi:hypothetical protein